MMADDVPKREPFLMLSSEIVRDPRHRRAVGDAVWLYLYLLDQADADERVVVAKRARMAESLGVSLRSVSNHLDLLAEKGYITRHSTGRATRIVILPLPARTAKPCTSEVQPIADQEGQKCNPLQIRSARGCTPEVQPVAAPISKIFLSKSFLSKRGEMGEPESTDPEPVDPAPPPPPGEREREDAGTPPGTCGQDRDGFARWWQSAREAYGEIRGAPLTGRDPTPGQRRQVESAARGRWGWQAVTVAWSLFLLDDPPGCGWLRGKPARTVPMYLRCLDDLLPVAARELKRRADRDARWDTPHWERGDGQAKPPPEPFAQFKRGPKERAVWERALTIIEGKVLEENFKTWFEPLQFGGINCTRAGLYTRSEFAARCMIENYSELASEALSEAAGRSLEAVFAVQPMEAVDD